VRAGLTQFVFASGQFTCSRSTAYAQILMTSFSWYQFGSCGCGVDTAC